MNGVKKIFCAVFWALGAATLFANPPAGANWKLVFEDDFNYADAELDKEWISQNGSSGHILSSRWRENAIVQDGILKLIGKKEQKGGQDWTAGNIWTKKLFKYGYFECRYKYAGAGGTNNSFWLMTQGWQKLPQDKKRFEIDINEGHYPDEINVNLHNHTDRWKDPQSGQWRHNAWGKSVCLSPESGRPDRQIVFDVPIVADKLRFSSKSPGYFHLAEFRAYPKTAENKYPDILKGEDFAGLENFAKGAKIIASCGVFEKHPNKKPEYAIDGNIKTTWITAPVAEKFLEIDLGKKCDIGCIQILTGWPRDGVYKGYIDNYKIEYWDGGKWVECAALAEERIVAADLSQDYHTYGLLWDEEWLIYYFDGKEIHRRKNDVAHWESPVWLSLAITHGAGGVTDAAHGKAMEIDYVKVWQAEGKEDWRDRKEGELLK